jgi:hypothetical protein
MAYIQWYSVLRTQTIREGKKNGILNIRLLIKEAMRGTYTFPAKIYV